MRSKLRLTAKLFLGGWMILLCSCAPKVVTLVSKSYKLQPDPKYTKVIDVGDTIPKGAEKLGTVMIGENGATVNCELENVMTLACIEASKIGGNILRIVKLSPPDFFSSCYRLDAEIYFLSSLADTSASKSPVQKAETFTQLIPNPRKYTYSFPTYRLALSTGYSYRFARLNSKIPDNLERYANELRSGMHFDADFTYYNSYAYGIGVKYSRSWFNNSMDVPFQLEDGTYTMNNMEDNIAITYIGPVFSYKGVSNRNRNFYYLNAGIGYLGFRNNSVLDGNLKITGSTVGFSLDFGYDIAISERFGMGFKVSLISGLISKVTLESGSKSQVVKLEKEDRENLSRVDLSVGIRFLK